MTTDQPGRALQAVALPDCPYCGGQMAYTLTDNGQPHGLVHSFPACNEVRTMPPEDFIMAARRKANPEWPAAFHDHLDTCDVCTDDGGWCLAGLALLGGKQ